MSCTSLKEAVTGFKGKSKASKVPIEVLEDEEEDPDVDGLEFYR